MSVFEFRRLVWGLIIAAAMLGATTAQAAPGWWRVSNGRAEVWILGAPRIVPRDLSWDTRAAEQRLAGANTVIVNPRARGTFAVAGLIFSSFSAQPLEEGLPNGLKQRFVAARQSLGKSAGDYANWKPAAAGKRLLDDFFATNGLQPGGIEARMIKLAHDRGVRDLPAGEYDPAVLIDQAKALSPSGQLTCLDASVHDVERGAGVVRAVAQDWARGAVADVPIDRIDRACVVALPAIDAQAERTLAEETEAVSRTLAQSGHAIAVFELHNMTQPNGVVDRLRALGLQVTGPTS